MYILISSLDLVLAVRGQIKGGGGRGRESNKLHFRHRLYAICFEKVKYIS